MTHDTNQEFSANAELAVNGKKVILNDFVQGFISQTLIGMVKSLHGVDDVETINLKISNNIQKE
jgi:hypothetical protein